MDKYLLKEFGLPLLYCFDAFVTLWIVQDLLNNLGDFLQAHVPIGLVFRYYLMMFPDVLVQFVPISLLLAALFCLSNLGRHNELTAFRASGVGVMRMSVPLLIVGVAATGVMFWLMQTFVPRAREHGSTYMKSLGGKAQLSVRRLFFFDNVPDHRTWQASSFNPSQKWLADVEIVQLRPDGSLQLKVNARQAQWKKNGWHLTDALVSDYSQSPELVVRVAETNFPSFNEKPQRLALEGRKPEQLNTTELRRYVRTQYQTRVTHLTAAYEVELYRRYAQPWEALLVLLLGVPLGMRVSRSGPMLGIGMALMLVVAYYFISHLSRAAGEGGYVPTLLAAWFTNIVFGGAGLLLMWRAR